MTCFEKHARNDTHVRQPVYPEPLGRPLLAHAVVTEVELAVGQLLDLEESRQTVGQTAHFLLLLRPASLQSVRYVQREVLEGLVRLRVRTTVHTVDLREETRSIIRPRFSQEEKNEEERDFGKRHQSLERAQKFLPKAKEAGEDVSFARNRGSLSEARSGRSTYHAKESAPEHGSDDTLLAAQS